MGKVAIFPGTFNPFTIGHSSIVERGLGLFDKIIIGIGINPEKDCSSRRAGNFKIIADLYAGNPRVEVMEYTGLTAEVVKETGACTILRGVRSVADFEYERNLADINKSVLGVETCFLFSLPEYAYVSGSMVRELKANGYDVSRFIAK